MIHCLVCVAMKGIVRPFRSADILCVRLAVKDLSIPSPART